MTKICKRVLQNNKTNVFFFACALRNAFLKTRQKNTNILIVGPTNCCKTFLLNPIELKFKAFVNPTTRWYAWVGLDECKVAYLNDYGAQKLLPGVTLYFCYSAFATVKKSVCNWHVHTRRKHNRIFHYQQGTDMIH